MSDFGEGRWKSGRKPHRCAGCRSVIPKGEVHFHFKGIYEGQWQDWRLHVECHESWDRNGCGEVSDDMPTPQRLQRATELVGASEAKP